MDKLVMLYWVDKVLKPYLLNTPPGIHPILLLDSYGCHMMTSVVQAIEELGCQVEHIPAGCTGICQSVDIDINN